ncbi:MAG: hypothetical protein C0392_13470 [Syntrophus sp. (in: bacteria)]|nr:hypothetical protein [Syntrophus sp. (in: bacteria)]
MDVIPFIQFTVSSRYVSRWIYGGLIIYIPVLNFFSLGYLSRASRLLMIGSIGLPTWERKSEVWVEGAKVLFVFILYGAIPFFMFACGFFLTALSAITGFFGHIVMKLSYLVLLISSFFVPFAFITFAEQMDFRKALEFERILQGIKEVFVPYLAGYVGTVLALILCWLVIPIPKSNFLQFFMVALFSLATYYVLLVATYYFTQLFRKTSLSVEIGEGT